MADRDKVAKQDGPFRTNRVNIESVEYLAPGYDYVVFELQEIGDTGRLKVLRVFPSDDQAEGPRFLARCDKMGDSLDFDLVDRHDNVVTRLPYGHHATPLGNRRFAVAIGRNANSIVFKGVVSVALAFGMHLGEGLRMVDGVTAELIHGTGTEPATAESGGQP